MHPLQANHGMGHILFHIGIRSRHGTVLMTTQWSSSSSGPLPLIHGVDFWVHIFFDSKQLFSPVCHLDYFKGVAILPERRLSLCFNDLIVTLPYYLVTITNPVQLGLWQEATLSDIARAWTFFWNFLWAKLMATSSLSEHVRQSPIADSGPE